MLLAWWSADANQYVLTEINGAWCFTLDETWVGNATQQRGWIPRGSQSVWKKTS